MAGPFCIQRSWNDVVFRLEEELDTTEELLSILAIPEVFTVEVLREETDVLEDCILRADFPALRALLDTIVRTHEGSILAKAAICSVPTPRTLVRSVMVVAIVILDLPSVVLIICLRVVRIGTPETVLRIERIAE